MPYGHLRQYKNLVNEAQQKRIQITKKQQRELSKIFENIAKDFEKKYSNKNKTTLTYRFLEDYAKQLKKNSSEIYNNIKTIIESNMLLTAENTVNIQLKFFSDLCPSLSARFSDVFSNIPQQAVNELLSGEIYQDFKGLSERLWNYKGKFNKDIQYIINQGIISKKSAYDLAKDLEIYLNPKAKKDFDWSNVYPNVNKKIDYSAQRLARTSITHAYQMAFVRSTKDNPFVEEYEWLSSNSSRSCELCISRNGKHYKKDSVPLDHPNGMCTLVAVIPKSYEQIADTLARYQEGEENKFLDDWLFKDSIDGDLKDFFKSAFKQDLSKQIRSFERHLKYVQNQDVVVLLEQAKERTNFYKSFSSKSYCKVSSRDIYLSHMADNETIAHELFHEIDRYFNIIDSGALTNNLKRDYQRMLDISRMAGKDLKDMIYFEYPEAFRKNISKHIMNEEYRGLSDILNGLSLGNINFGYKHKTEYWSKPKKVERETWAQFGRILYSENQQVIRMLRDLLPNTYEEVMYILRELTK